MSFTARIEGTHSDRAASASKKDGLPAPLPPLQRPRVARAQRQDHRASSFLLLTPPRGWPEVPFDCAHRTSIHINDPSKLARFTFLGMAPVLVPLRPSSEHILIVRAPGQGISTGVIPPLCEQEGHSGYPLHPPCPADLNIRAIHIPCIIGEQISYGSHGIVYSSDVSGWDAFCHAGEFFRRRTA